MPFVRFIMQCEQSLSVKWLIYKGICEQNYRRYATKVSFFGASGQKEGRRGRT